MKRDVDGEKRGLDRGGEGMVPLLLNGGVLRETEIKFQNGGEKKKKKKVTCYVTRFGLFHFNSMLAT